MSNETIKNSSNQKSFGFCHWETLLIFFSLFIICSAFASEEILSQGGPGADLSKAEIPGQGKPTGPNLFLNGDFHDTEEWRSSFYVDPAPGLNRAIAEPKLRKISQKTFVKGENGHVYGKITTSEKLSEIFKNTSGITALSGFHTSFNLGSVLKTKQEFCFSFRYRGKSTNTKLTHGLYTVVSFRNGHKGLGNFGKYNLPLSSGWRQAEFRITAPAGTATIGVTLGLTGAGVCEFGDAVIRKVPPVSQKLWVEIYTTEAVDSTHYEMREKAPVAISIAPYGQKTGKWLNLYLKLPKGIDITGCGMFLGSQRTAKTVEKISEDPDGILYRLNADRLPTTEGHYHRTGTLMLNNTLAADGKDRTITYYAEDAAGKTLPKTMKLVITKGERAPAPKRFITGGYSATDLMFDNDNAEKAAAEIYASVGFNNTRSYISLNVRNIFAKRGIRHMEAIWGMGADGYIFGIDMSKKSPDILFTGIDGKPFRNSNGREEFKTAICPVILYTKSPYRENVIKPVIEQVFKEKSQDFLYANWEPVIFDYKGCFCDRCRDEFIRYSKLPAETVKKVWPKEVLNLYREQWVKFRSWQHSKVVGMVVDMLDELSKKYNCPVEFAPGIHHLAAKEKSGFGQQYKIDDYLNKIRWIVLWGPYLYYDYSSPYTQNIGYHLHIWNQAGFNVKYLTDRVKDSKKRPKLIALPNLQQPSKYFLTEPEAPAFETLTYFVQGWNGSLIYFLPIGVDNRYWNSFARANRQIAAYEDYIFDGKDFRNYNVDAIIPLPKNPVASWGYFKDPDSVPPQNTSLIQSKAFRLNDKHLVAVGNFWENGECFFKLSVKGLDPKKTWHISQPDSGKYFGSFRASELAKGVTLHAGAMRWAFYVIAPEKFSGCNTVVNQKTVNSILKKRLPEIRQQYNIAKKAFEGAVKRENAAANVIAGLQAMKHGNVTLSPVGQLIQVKTPAYTALLDLNNGAILNSLKTKDGTEWAGKGALGTTRFMQPVNQTVNSGFRLLGCEKMKNGSILVKTERRFMDGKYPKLAGMIILKNYECSKDSIIVSDTFKNGSDSEVTLSTSSHNFPGALSFKGKQTGTAKMNGAVYSRCNMPWTYKIGNFEVSKVQKLYDRSAKSGSIKDGPVVFSAPWSKTVLTASWDGNQADFLAYWGTFDMECGTFEIHWKEFSLPSGAAKTSRVKWTFKGLREI